MNGTRVVAGLFAVVTLVVFGGAFALIGGFADPGDIHAMHSFGWAAMTGAVMGGSLVTLAVRPRWVAPLLAVIVTGSVFFLVSLFAGFDPFVLVFPLIGLIVWAVRGGSLFDDSFAVQSKAILASAVVALVPAAIYAWNQIQLQTSAVAEDPHAMEGHYVGMAAVALVLPLVAAMLSAKPTGWRVVGWLTGLAAIVFGVGSLVVDQASEIADLPAVVVIAAGAAFVAVIETTRALDS